MACELAKLVRHLYDSFSNGVFFDTRGKTTAVRRNSTASLTDLGQDSEDRLQPVCVDLCALRHGTNWLRRRKGGIVSPPVAPDTPTGGICGIKNPTPP